MSKPFFLSFMSVEKTKQDRLQEAQRFAEIAVKYIPQFKAPVALQVNFSCPNVSHKIDDLEFEVSETLKILNSLNIPLVPKFSITLSPEIIMRMCNTKYCDGICVSNTVPWGQMNEYINWKKITGYSDSPLQELGGGGLSGKVLLPLVVDWVKEIRALGFTKPINAGGGILSPEDVDDLFDAGADSVFIGTVAILRWWRIKGIIEKAYEKS